MALERPIVRRCFLVVIDTAVCDVSCSLALTGRCSQPAYRLHYRQQLSKGCLLSLCACNIEGSLDVCHLSRYSNLSFGRCNRCGTPSFFGNSDNTEQTAYARPTLAQLVVRNIVRLGCDRNRPTRSSNGNRWETLKMGARFHYNKYCVIIFFFFRFRWLRYRFE